MRVRSPRVGSPGAGFALVRPPLVGLAGTQAQCVVGHIHAPRPYDGSMLELYDQTVTLMLDGAPGACHCTAMAEQHAWYAANGVGDEALPGPLARFKKSRHRINDGTNPDRATICYWDNL